MAYSLMWSLTDKAAISAEMAALRAAGYDAELAQVVSYLVSIAKRGRALLSQNIHMPVGGRNLHLVVPFGTVGAFYAYNSPPVTELYVLMFCSDPLRQVGNAAARVANVP